MHNTLVVMEGLFTYKVIQKFPLQL